VSLQASVEVVALAETTNKDNTGHDLALCTESLDLALNQVTHLLYYRLENLLDLLSAHHKEPRVEAGFFIVG
jgi:hypothetical protein